ncbi:Plasma membrane fusion protein PRM1 [Bienertia sinuspersici]
MKTTKTHQNKLMKIIKMPIRALAKARDFYVRSMNNYADKACYGGGISYADPLPRSFSTTSTRSNDNDDFRELIRAASTNTLGNRIDLNSVITNKNKPHHNLSNSNNGGIKGVPRSASVGMAKIEEDKPIEFNDNFNGVNLGLGVNDGGNVKQSKFGIFPRSRSYAVGATKRTSTVL